MNRDKIKYTRVHYLLVSILATIVFTAIGASIAFHAAPDATNSAESAITLKSIQQKMEEIEQCMKVLDEELHALLVMVSDDHTSLNTVIDRMIPLEHKIGYHDDMLEILHRQVDEFLLRK